MYFKMLETTNPQFKYLIGTSGKGSIGLVLWMGNFHTSAIETMEYEKMTLEPEVTVHTRNSTYKFKMSEAPFEDPSIKAELDRRDNDRYAS